MGNAKGVAILFAGVLAVACDQLRSGPPPRQVPGGEVGAGKVALQRYGCGGCHVIPGVDLAKGVVGPPLTNFGDRAYVAGVVSNTADNLVTWIRKPHAVDPQTAMPALDVGEKDARDMAAYLYSLRAGKDATR